jgi:hypothetical protein
MVRRIADKACIALRDEGFAFGRLLVTGGSHRRVTLIASVMQLRNS